jgi:gas vesicle protein
MKQSYITSFLFDLLPFERKSSADWILPSAVGLGLGVAAGVGIGILLAPRSGAETRERLLASAEDLKYKARDLADRAKGQISTATHQLGQQIGQQIGNGLASSSSSTYSSDLTSR